jgi:class 3 adenylate cyclase
VFSLVMLALTIAFANLSFPAPLKPSDYDTLFVQSMDWKGEYPMNAEEFKRKLTAILSADVEGYSRLMRDNEDETIRTITAYRASLTQLVQQYRGRVVDSPGDNIMS